jgi:hypothetical protein
MAITFTDKLRIICHVCGVFSRSEFVAAYTRQQEKMGLIVDPTKAEANRRQYFEKFSEPQMGGEPRKILVAMLQDRANAKAPHLGKIDDLLDSTLTTPQFIEFCRVRFPDLEANKIVTADAVQDWVERYNGLHFMQRLDEFEEHEDGKKLLEAILGTYHRYRRHSVLPGILREVVVVSKRRYGNSEGTYYQYNRTKPKGWNEINFNVFFAGFYLLAFAAFKAEARDIRTEDRVEVDAPGDLGSSAGSRGAEFRRKTRTEILEIKVLIDNALLTGEVQCDQSVFAGILTGIYDYGNILLAERILLRRISSKRSRIENMVPVRLLSDDKESAAEYYSVLDAIDNGTNGQTLSIRPIHLEKPYLRDELLPSPETFTAPGKP